MSIFKPTQVTFIYTNWKGETRLRTVVPLSIEYNSSEFHKDEQWLLKAYDVEKKEWRTFAMKDIKDWKPAEQPKLSYSSGEM